MTDQEKMSILEGAKTAFFEAMLDGYTGGENRKSTKVKDDDGYTTITYVTEDGKYKVVDRYCTTPLSEKSAGTITIFHSENLVWVPVWWMTYSGQYKKEAIPFLKKALRQAYEHTMFCGGRGSYSRSPSEEYANTWTGDFAKFEGNEAIFSANDIGDPNVRGHHKYSGMSLL